MRPARARPRGRMTTADRTDQQFSGGVMVLFGTQVFQAGVGILSGILLARLLGPTEKGHYYFLTLLPATAMVILQLGLPRAFGYYTARGVTVTILSKAFALTALLTVVAIAGLIAVVRLVAADIMQELGIEQFLLAFLAFPLQLSGAFTIAIVMGRKAVRWYAARQRGLHDRRARPAARLPRRIRPDRDRRARRVRGLAPDPVRGLGGRARGGSPPTCRRSTGSPSGACSATGCRSSQAAWPSSSPTALTPI